MPRRPLRQRVREFLFSQAMRLRYRYWKCFLAHVGPGTKFIGPLWIGSPELVSIGTRCTFNRGVIINARAPIVIGDHVRISSGVIINAGGLEYRTARDARKHTEAPVTIEHGAWLGAGAIINPGVVIGEDAVVGAGSVVIQNVPPRTLVFGVPARVVQSLT